MFDIRDLGFHGLWVQVKGYVLKWRLMGFPFIPSLIIFTFIFMAFFGDALAP